MTACVNKKHTRRVALAVSASLVGALSLGAAAPAVATGIDAQFAEGGLDGTEFANGSATPTFMCDSDNDGVFDKDVATTVNEDGVYEVSAENMPYVVSVDSLDVAGTSSKTQINEENVHDYKIRVYKADENGDPTGGALSGNKVKDAGEYVVTVTALTGSPYAGQTYRTNFVVKGVALPKVTAYEDGDTTDTHFKYTGSAIDIDFMNADDKTELREGEDYSVTYTKNNKAVESVTDAGTYVATLTGMGKYAGSTTDCTVEVEKFKIDATANTVLGIAPFDEKAPTTPYKVAFKDPDTDDVTNLDPTLVTLNPVGSTSGLGLHQFTVSTDDPNIELGAKVANKTHTWSARRVENIVDFTYNNKATQDVYELFASEGDEFDTSDIKAYNGKNEVSIDWIDVQYVKNAWMDSGYYTWDPTDDLNDGKVGIYTVTATAEDTVNNEYAGVVTFKVVVYKGALDADQSVYVYGPNSGVAGSNTKPVAITSYAKGYDGEELQAGDFSVLFSGQAADDLTVKLTDAEGNEVDSAVDAGSYKLVVTSDWYKLSGTTELPITIGKVDLSTVKLNSLVQWNDVAGEWYLPLEDLNTTAPGFQGYDCTTVDSIIDGLGLAYDTGNGSEDKFDGDNYVGYDLLPAVVDAVVEYNDGGTWKEVGEIKEAGQYRVTITVGDDIAANFEGTEKAIEFTVAQKSAFSDVQPGAWYYGAVLKAVDNDYVHGDAGSTTFRPEASITRGEVAVILYNMSGQKDSFELNENNSSYYVEGQGWKTGFDDVDGNQFYAAAVAWAKRAGVVNGDAGTSNFRPDDTVTSEEFAAMLANYAEKVNQDSTVAEADPSSLDAVSDGDQVSAWAEKVVAWAVENEVMGNNGAPIDPHGDIYRARVAAMCVNYQPNAKN